MYSLAASIQVEPQMAGLCWLSVVLTFVLSAGDTVTAVDQNWLTSIVEGLKNQYPLRDAFTVAVSIPENQDPNELQQVLQGDPADQVKQAVSQGQVYRGTRVVAAVQPEAVSRVLKNIDSLTQSSQGNFLIIYSSESPCGPACTNTNQDGIADKINDVIQNWSGYAFAFSNVVDVPDVSTSQMAQSFQQLAVAKMGLDNIFRCYNPGEGGFQCTSCSSGGAVAPSCVANTAPSTPEQGAGEESGLEQVDTGDLGGISGGGREPMGGGKPGRVSRCKQRRGVNEAAGAGVVAGEGKVARSEKYAGREQGGRAKDGL
ncbi:hypothetical protein INR49_004762 [Caranx melampygus]|nr:hypothetical protein INR49_004762 [Caranx melampygus]